MSTAARARGFLVPLTWLLVATLGPLSLYAGEAVTSDGKDAKVTKTEAAAETEPTNWIELGIGGLIINGDEAQFKQEHRMSGDVFGGIQDFHYQQDIGGKDGATLTADGHAIWDNNDYDVKVKLEKAKVGYIMGGYQAFRSWYDGNGGFFPPHHTFFEPPFQEMHIDRGDAWVELGLRVPDLPEVTIRYDHMTRDGMKDSTIWGDTTLTQGPLPTPPPSTTNPGLTDNPTRKIVPAFRAIDETRDVLSLDIAKTFGNTDATIGMRYEHDDIQNALNLERGAGQLPPAVPAPGQQRFITQHDNESSDVWNGHAITETRFTDNFWFTSAYSYSSDSADISGSRIIGPTYYSTFANFPQLQSNDHAVINLAGMAFTQEHVVNSNLFYIPIDGLHVIGGFRYTHENTESSSMFLDFNTSGAPPHYTLGIPRVADTDVSLDDFSERLELRYNKIKDWLFYAEAEWDEETGNVFEHEGGGTIVNAPAPPHVVLQNYGELNKDTSLFGQKYTAGTNWFPCTQMNLSLQYYYKADSYDNNVYRDLNTPPQPGAERNQRLIGQDWTTNDVNFRLTWHPKIPASLGTLTIVSRYDFIQTEISGKWAISPNATGSAPTNTYLNEEMTGLITQHSFTESINWNPLPRFYMDGTFSYILNQTETPVGHTNLIATGAVLYPGPSVPNFRNDYWTVTGGAGYVIDDKTDLHCEYTYYRAPDYVNYSQVGLPYGAGQTEQTFSATLTRELSKSMRVLFRYSYFTYEDQTSGNHNNYEAHAFYSGLQIRF